MNQHQGCCQAPASKPYCCVTAASALITGPSLQMRQAGRAVTFHFLQLQGSSRALYPFQELPILAARHQDHQPAVPRCRQQGSRSTCQWPQRQTEPGKHTKQAQVRISYTISQRKSIRYRIIGISHAISHTISHAISHLNRYRMRYRI